jgi:tmRNA-binding protein
MDIVMLLAWFYFSATAIFSYEISKDIEAGISTDGLEAA